MRDTIAPDRWRIARAAVVAGALAGLVAATAPPASAGEPDWPSGPYRYMVIDQAVSDALAELGRNTGLPVSVSDKVEGRLTGGMPLGTAREFLDRICDAYGLVWYFDGSTLHVSTETEVRTELIELGPHAPDDIARRLEQLDISDERYPIRIPEDGDVVSVSGPPPYIALIRKTVTAMARARSPRIAREVVDGDAVSVRVFRGRSDGS